MRIDVVCPLWRANDYIDDIIASLQAQEGVELVNVVFPVTQSGETQIVLEKITAAGFSYFLLPESEFSHSLTREKAIKEYCTSDIVIMMSQDVKLINADAIAKLAAAISGDVAYAYGKQICQKKTIEHYVRKGNYGDSSRIVGREDIAAMQLKAFFASDAFAAYHRPTFLALNGYDGVHMMMSEDMYYAKKVLEGGYKKAYVADAVVEHSHKLTLKQLYNRYYATGRWFAEHPEFQEYHATDSGFRLAIYVLKQALKSFNLPVLFCWLPNMAARYLGMKHGKRGKRKK